MKWAEANAWMACHRPARALFTAILVGIAGAGWVRAAGPNIAVDAVTRATTGYNQYQGKLADLTDGADPDNASDPGAFRWPNKGDLIFQFNHPRRVDGVRIYVGEDAGAYQVTAYLGAEYGRNGQTVLENAVILAKAHDFSFRKHGWTDLLFAESVETDYLELATESGAVFYEIQILGSGKVRSSVDRTSWGHIKAPTGGLQGQHMEVR